MSKKGAFWRASFFQLIGALNSSD